MSIPKVDPKMTVKELQKEAALFIAAGYRYWEAAHRAGIGGAVIWVEDTDKGFVLFSRGEYKDTILRNIEPQGKTTYFGSMRDE